VGRETCALGAERVLDHLNQNLLPFLEQIRDIRVHWIGLLSLVVLGEEHVGEIIENSTGLPDIEECVAAHSNVDKGGLHAWQNPAYPSLVNVADHRRGAVTFRSIRNEARVLKHGHPRFEGIDGEKEIGGHY